MTSSWSCRHDSGLLLELARCLCCLETLSWCRRPMSCSQIPRKRHTLIGRAGVQMSRYASLHPGIQSKHSCTSNGGVQG